MQAWDSVLVHDADSQYNGQAGCVVTVKRDGSGAVISADVRMDSDASVQTFALAQLQRLG